MDFLLADEKESCQEHRLAAIKQSFLSNGPLYPFFPFYPSSLVTS